MIRNSKLDARSTFKEWEKEKEKEKEMEIVHGKKGFAGQPRDL